jgi:hypothetical protein
MSDLEFEFGIPVERVMAVAVFALVGIMALFGLLVLVRLWSLRVRKGGGPSGGLDVERLRRQRDAGQISPEEFDAICAGLAGMRPRAAKAGPPPPGKPINQAGESGAKPERSDSSGQG